MFCLDKTSIKYTRWWFEIFYTFTLKCVEIPISTNIFQMGWNHRPGYWLEFQTTWNISELDLKQSISFHWDNYFCCPCCWDKKIKSSRPGCPKESGSHVQLNVGVATVESLTKLLTLARSQKGLALHLSAHAYRNDKAGTRWIGWMDGEFQVGNGGVVGNFRWLSWSLRGSWDVGWGLEKKTNRKWGWFRIRLDMNVT